MYRSIKVLFLVISISEACRSNTAQVKTETKTISSLPIPYPKHMVITDPATVTVRWEPVTVSKDNPILGFKIKLWEDQKKKVQKYVEKDGEQVLVEELVRIKKPFHELPTHDPAYISIVPPDVFVTHFDVKIGEHYEVRGQTFNTEGDGPLSYTYGFSIRPSEEDQKIETNTETEDSPEDAIKVTVIKRF